MFDNASLSDADTFTDVDMLIKFINKDIMNEMIILNRHLGASCKDKDATKHELAGSLNKSINKDFQPTKKEIIRAKRLEEFERTLAGKTWLSHPVAQSLMEKGPVDSNSQLVYSWLKAHKGKKVHFTYQTTEGSRFSKESEWTIDDPEIPIPVRLEPNFFHLRWNIPSATGFKLPLFDTYCEVKAEPTELIIKIGYKNLHGRDGIEGLLGIKNISEAEVWETYVFKLII
jgi:hypothetical protein